MSLEKLFENQLGVAHFHDAVFDATYQSKTDDELKALFGTLPDAVKDIALEWGLSDTVFRDKVVGFLRSKV